MLKSNIKFFVRFVQCSFRDVWYILIISAITAISVNTDNSSLLKEYPLLMPVPHSYWWFQWCLFCYRGCGPSVQPSSLIKSQHRAIKGKYSYRRSWQTSVISKLWKTGQGRCAGGGRKETWHVMNGTRVIALLWSLHICNCSKEHWEWEQNKQVTVNLKCKSYLIQSINCPLLFLLNFLMGL